MSGIRMTEAEVCERFAAAARKDGWTVYPEVAEWYLLLVWYGDRLTEDDESRSTSNRRPDGAPGWVLEPLDQFGIEAKTRANVKALAQVLKRTDSFKAPTWAGIVAPKVSGDYTRVCRRLGIVRFSRFDYDIDNPHRSPIRPHPRFAFTGPLPRGHGNLWVPPVVPHAVVAGAPSPSPLTPWRVAALQICSLLRESGWVTATDFKHRGIDINLWRYRPNPWIVDSGERRGRLYVYELPETVPADFPDVGFEADRDAIAKVERSPM